MPCRYVPPHLRSKQDNVLAEKGLPPGFASVVDHVSQQAVQQLPDIASAVIAEAINPSTSLLNVQPRHESAVASADDSLAMLAVGVAALDQQASSELETPESAAAQERRQRKFRQGFAAYTPPPLLDKHGAESNAQVRLELWLQAHLRLYALLLQCFTHAKLFRFYAAVCHQASTSCFCCSAAIHAVFALCPLALSLMLMQILKL